MHTNVVHKPSRTGLLSSRAAVLIWIGLSADRVFFLRIRNYFLERFNFSLHVGFTTLVTLGLLSSFFFLATPLSSSSRFSRSAICYDGNKNK